MGTSVDLKRLLSLQEQNQFFKIFFEIDYKHSSEHTHNIRACLTSRRADLEILYRRTDVGFLSPPNTLHLPSGYEHHQSPDAHQSKHSACTRPCDDQPRGTEKPLPQPAENSYKMAHKKFSLYNL